MYLKQARMSGNIYFNNYLYIVDQKCIIQQLKKYTLDSYSDL